jgi:hypothetical protein
VEALRRNYRIAFLRYLPSRDEAALAMAYDIGRSAVADHLLERAAEFVAEVLASVEMVQRSLRAP